MLNHLARQQRVTTAAATLGPPPVTNLKSALAHLPEADPTKVTNNLEAWFQVLQQGPDPAAAALVSLNNELQVLGNTHGDGPQMILVNTGGNNLEILTCLIKLPQTGVPNTQTTDPINGQSHVAVLGDRRDATNSWLIVPTNAAKLFAKTKARLADWNAIPAANNTSTSLPAARRGPQQPFFPIFPSMEKKCAHKCTKVSIQMIRMHPNGIPQPSLKSSSPTWKPSPTPKSKNLPSSVSWESPLARPEPTQGVPLNLTLLPPTPPPPNQRWKLGCCLKLKPP